MIVSVPTISVDDRSLGNMLLDYVDKHDRVSFFNYFHEKRLDSVHMILPTTLCQDPVGRDTSGTRNSGRDGGNTQRHASNGSRLCKRTSNSKAMTDGWHRPWTGDKTMQLGIKGVDQTDAWSACALFIGPLLAS